MKIITLNLWGGKVYEPLMKFLRKYSKSVDIFCFQELLFGSKAEFTPLRQARINIFSEIKKRFSDFTTLIYYAPKESVYFESELLTNDIRTGQVIFAPDKQFLLESL